MLSFFNSPLWTMNVVDYELTYLPLVSNLFGLVSTTHNSVYLSGNQSRKCPLASISLLLPRTITYNWRNSYSSGNLKSFKCMTQIDEAHLISRYMHEEWPGLLNRSYLYCDNCTHNNLFFLRQKDNIKYDLLFSLIHSIVQLDIRLYVIYCRQKYWHMSETVRNRFSKLRLLMKLGY